ncbi:DUF2306 domain-containing protein [bacterium AH-315-P15]|nr:DUF2306 domain-containing protein [bacterium AH-315-P15]
MTDAVSTGSTSQNSFANAALKGSAALWWLTAVASAWVFVYYLMAYYISPALQGGLAAWTNTRLVTGYVSGDAIGNSVVAAHIFLAALVLSLGPFQLVPQIRAYIPAYHRMFGRIFIAAAVATSFGGLYMTWVRGDPQAGVIEHIGTSTNAVLILIFAAMALRYAMARDIDTHRRWALRLFMVVMAGSVFIRAGIGLWFLYRDMGGAGNFKAFSIFISYAHFLVPLAILELYLRTQGRADDRGKFVMAVGLFLTTLIMGVGIYKAAMVMWLPRLS